MFGMLCIFKSVTDKFSQFELTKIAKASLTSGYAKFDFRHPTIQVLQVCDNMLQIRIFMSY